MSGNETPSMREHFESSLHMPLPDFWEKLDQHVPWAMDAYFQMRRNVFHPVGEEGDGVPKKYMDMFSVVIDIMLDNRWGVEAHTKAAVRAGATMDEIRQMVVICLMGGGMVRYRLAGHLALSAAEEAFAEIAAE